MTPKSSKTRKVWKCVKLFLALAIPLIIIMTQYSWDSVNRLVELCLHIYEHNFSFLSLTILLLVMTYVKYRPKRVYMVDFACYKPDPESAVKLSWASFVDLTTRVGTFSEENVSFQKKVLERSGLGEETYLPKSFMKIPPLKASVEEIKKEARMYMIVVIDELLGKSKVKAKDIGILIVNSSLFHPTPSSCAILINHYDFREDVRTYNLAAMGCSAGLIAVDLAARLLQVHANTNALVVSLEQGTQSNWYMGNERSMLLGNCIFRAGVAAMLLSNKRSARSRASYQLIHTVRTNKAAEDKCYSCVYQQEDLKNITGITLSKDLMSVAGKALNTNITTLGPLVLPYSEQLLYFITLVARKTFKMKKIVKQYVPDFKLAFEHFCIHPGGKAVLDEVEKSDLQLSKWHMEPSRMTLYRFGNTSSSGLWYVLAYLEARGRIKKGDRIWQIAFGSGFKCNSVVWRAMKTIDPPKEMNPWVGEIDNLPIYE